MKLKPVLFVSFAAWLSLPCLAADPLIFVKDDDMQGPVGTVTEGDRKDCGFDLAPHASGEARGGVPPSIEITGLPEVGTPVPAPLHLSITLAPRGSDVKLSTLKVLYLRETRKDLTSLVKDRMKNGFFESDVVFPKGQHRILICVRDNNNLPAMKVPTFEVK